MLLTRRDIGRENQKSTSIRTQTPKKVRTPKWSPPPPQLFWHHVSFFFFFFFLASSSSSAGYRITQSSTCAWISAHICVCVSYFLESPPDSFQIFLASFEFIWITTVRLIAGGELLPNWIPWRFHLLIGPVVLADQLVYQFLVWKTSGDSNSIGLTPPFFSRLGEKLPSRRHLRRPDGHVHSTANIR